MKLSALIVCFGLSPLAGQSAASASDAAENADVLCMGDEDCQMKWQRAEKWVRDNSRWPIKTASDTIIETEKQRFRNYSSLYYKITKEQHDGTTVIVFQAGCLPSVQCSPDVESAREAFNRFVRD